MSLSSEGDHAISHTYGAYLGAKLFQHLDAYLDAEMARGKGISHASGLAGVTNGDVLRQGTADLPSENTYCWVGGREHLAALDLSASRDRTLGIARPVEAARTSSLFRF